MKVSVVIPAYNEAHRIIPTLDALELFFSNQNHSFEAIIVNDGSTDTTESLVKNYIKNHSQFTLLTLKKNRGKGFAVRAGMQASHGDCILFMDADSSTSITELPKLLSYISDYDIVIGSRHLDNKVKAPFHRKIITSIGNRAVRILFGFNIADTQCGFKLFRRNILTTLLPHLSISGFSFDIELLALAQHHHYKIKEVPVVWNHHHGSRFRPFRDTIKSAAEILRIYLHS